MDDSWIWDFDVLPFYLAITKSFRDRTSYRAGGLFGVLGSRCSMLDCHVLKRFGIYMIGILDRLY